MRSFRCKLTERFFIHGERVNAFQRIEASAMRKLAMLDAASDLSDLRVPPANRLEALKGDRTGRYSIRINGQYRVCFVWTTQGPSEVEICDYH